MTPIESVRWRAHRSCWMQIRTIYEFDAEFVVPMYGYDNVEHYYSDASPFTNFPLVSEWSLLLCFVFQSGLLRVLSGGVVTSRSAFRS